MSVQSVSPTMVGYQAAESNYLRSHPNADPSDSSFETNVMEYAYVNGYNMGDLNTSQYLTGNNQILTQTANGQFIDFNTQTGQEDVVLNDHYITIGHDQVTDWGDWYHA